MQGNEIGLGQQRIQVGIFDLQRLFFGGFHPPAVMIKNLHVESPGPLRDRLADAAEADDAEGLARYFPAQEQERRPEGELTGPDPFVSLDDPPRNR